MKLMWIFDEIIYAEELLKRGLKNQNKYYKELFILAKYYFHLGFTYEETEKKVLDFCSQYLNCYNKDVQYAIFNKIIHDAQKKKIITGRTVTINQSEIDFIDGLNNKKMIKLTFILLVIYKFNHMKKIYISNDELFRLAEVKVNNNVKDNIIHLLVKSKVLLTDTWSDKLKYKIPIAEPVAKEPVITITDFRDILLHYKQYKQSNIKHCEVCGRLIEEKSNRQKYCKGCWKENWKKYNAQKQKEYRKQKRVCLEKPSK